MSAIKPSSMLGSFISNCIDVKIVDRFKLGFQAPLIKNKKPLGGIFNKFRHILPPLSMFG
jgi:hypothetical protein